jgi:hypothetical protein
LTETVNPLRRVWQPRSKAFETVIASAAKQSISRQKGSMDCFAVLAMTGFDMAGLDPAIHAFLC